MTPQEHHDILEKLAYYYNELCETKNIKTTREYNWEMAKRMFDVEYEVNGESWLITLLKEDKDE